jgi:hypothetical protein
MDGTLQQQKPQTVGMNGYGITLYFSLNATANAAFGPRPPDADVKAGRAGVRICIVHPKFPSDLTITTASGNSYWCD